MVAAGVGLGVAAGVGLGVADGVDAAVGEAVGDAATAASANRGASCAGGSPATAPTPISSANTAAADVQTGCRTAH
ncbi:MAG TPA: hypothetical protein VLM05_16340, partial [Mycobacteriales bacterium]|nr:hypothetical protein [Mycobacteriales bacterium]